MISKLPVPLALLKNTLGIREDCDIVSIKVANDVAYFYTVSEQDVDPDAIKFTTEEPMQFSYAVGANETSQTG